MDQRHKNWIKIPLSVLLALIPLLVLVNWTGARWDSLEPGQIWEGEISAQMEAYVRANLPFRRQLQEMGLALQVIGGAQEQNGVFIARRSLLKNVFPADDTYGKENTQAVLEVAQYASELGVPVTLALIPTASAIRQQDLPYFAQTFNQRQFIEETYQWMYGKVSTVDLYTPLFAARGQYLYYRTENNLTGLGGYYVYQTLGERLGLVNLALDQYDTSYASTAYYGDLYEISPYKDVDPDLLMMFHYNGLTTAGGGRGYLVTHQQDGKSWVYHTLYPTFLADLGRDMDLYLGGMSAVTRVETSSFNRDLLIFGDKTALAYLPFLCNHYRSVTLVDLLQDEENFRDLRLENYEQVLFAYSVESYTASNMVTRTAAILER